MENYQEKRLSNGIRLLTENLSHINSVAVGVWIKTGSLDENEANNGISHLIEHLLFQGTENRTAKELAEEVDAVGGQLNAYTSKEHTCFFIRILDQHLPLAVDVLSDMINHSLFSEEDIEKEKKVVIEEIKMAEDTPDDLVHELLALGLWPDDAIGRPIAGKAEGVANLTRADILDYYKKHYVNENMTISIVGNIDKDVDLEKMIQEKFTATDKGVEQKVSDNFQPIVKIKTAKKDIEQTHICLGCRTFSRYENKKRYALTILENILGGGVSSRLFQKVREERGLVYTIYNYSTYYEKTGGFGIYAGTSPDNVLEVLELIIKELVDVRDNGVTEKELRRVKDQLKGNIVLGLEGTMQRMSRLAKCYMSFDRLIPIDELFASLEAVTLEDVKEVAKLFKAENFVLAAVGDVDEEQEKLWQEKISLLG